MRRLLLILAAVSLGAALSSTASASWKVEYGLQDDAWLEVGTPRMSSLDGRLAMLDRLGVGVVRYTVAGGATSPRATRTALSAVAFMRGMRRAGARFDVYSHHPYPRWFGRGRPETPLQTLPCTRWLTMASLQCLLRNVTQNFGPKHVWLTEYAYKTNPPDRYRGVPFALQARFVGEAARRVYQAPRVDVLINFLLRDEPVIGRWSSGFFTAGEVVKPSFFAFMLPLAEISRRGGRTIPRGQVRPRSRPQPAR